MSISVKRDVLFERCLGSLATCIREPLGAPILEYTLTKCGALVKFHYALASKDSCQLQIEPKYEIVVITDNTVWRQP